MVSIIVVSWNSERFISDCLSSIKMQSYNPIETIVVDNGSEDRSVELIRQMDKEVKLIKNNTNMGFCRANNQGLAYAQGDYIFFLNADVILEKRYIEEALNSFKIDKHIGMVSGKILRFDRKTIDSTGQFLSRARRAIERGYGEPDKGQYEEDGYIFSVCGAAALYRRQMVDELMLNNEFFDEDYFAFYEDLDLGWRAHLLGWVGYYNPRAVAYHYRGGSQQQRGWLARFSQFSQRPTELKFHILKNRYLTIMKNDRIRSFFLCLPWFLKYEVLIYGYLLFFDPKVLLKMRSFIPYLKNARQKRKLLKKKIEKIKAA
jgi:GT2 family glycosyltransferase